MSNPTFKRVLKQKDSSTSTTTMADVLGAFTPNKPLEFILGTDVDGNNLIVNLCDMPHMLIGGSTGSGKSNFIHSVISCLINKYSKQELKLILIDPKLVEFEEYANAPQVIKIANSRAEAEAYPTIQSLYTEVMARYTLFKNKKVKSIQEYNAVAEDKLPYIVTIIDEFADLLANENITDALVQVTQISRATGVHFIIATQRPSADIINGKIKANFPARIAFKVPSSQDSITILGSSDADRITDVGDFLYTLSGVKDLRQARAIWTPTEYTRSMVATLTDNEYKNIQRPISLSACVNDEMFNCRDYRDEYGGIYTRGDFDACMIYVFNKGINEIKLADLSDIVTGKQIRRCILREFLKRGIINKIADKYIVNSAVLMRNIQPILPLNDK